MRIPAQELETAVIGALFERLRDQQWVAQAVGTSGVHEIRKAIEHAARQADALEADQGERIGLLTGLLDR